MEELVSTDMSAHSDSSRQRQTTSLNMRGEKKD